jgi:hypothetical protein
LEFSSKPPRCHQHLGQFRHVLNPFLIFPGDIRGFIASLLGRRLAKRGKITSEDIAACAETFRPRNP